MPTFPGPTFYFDVAQVLGPGDGEDLDGDGVNDNALWVLADQLNPVYAAQIGSDTLDVLLDLPHLPTPPLEVGAHSLGALYYAVDAQPAPPGGAAQQQFHQDKLDGHGTFLVPAAQFDVDCQATSNVTVRATGPTSL
jgi:hypothetical protein